MRHSTLVDDMVIENNDLYTEEGYHQFNSEMDNISVSTLSFPDTEIPIRWTNTFNNQVNISIRGRITEIQESQTLTVQFRNAIKCEACCIVTENNYVFNTRLHESSECDVYYSFCKS